jgi:hypothetical protein
VTSIVFFSTHRTPPRGAQSRQSRDKSGCEKNNTCHLFLFSVPILISKKMSYTFASMYSSKEQSVVRFLTTSAGERSRGIIDGKVAEIWTTLVGPNSWHYSAIEDY